MKSTKGLRITVIMLILAMTVAMLFSSAVSTAAYDEGGNYTNIVCENSADPFVLLYDGIYYKYCTNASSSGFVVHTSPDLVHWTRQGYCLQKDNNTTVWGTNWFWAPEVIEKDGTFYMCYSSMERLCIATSSSPLGPFTQSTVAPLTLRSSESQYQATTYNGDAVASYCPNGEIDGHFYVDDDGQMYLYFVRFGDGYGNCVYGAKMNSNMTVDKTTIVRLVTAQTYAWEHVGGYYVAEGPEMLKHNGKYYLTYSCNGYTEHEYAVGCATSSTPLGSFSKYSTPILKGDLVNTFGVGHHCFVKSPDGTELFMVYHRHYSETSVQSRTTCIDRATFTSGGVLQINGGKGPSITPQPLPSGVDYSAVYVDFENGVDTNDGLTPLSPVKYISKGITLTGGDTDTVVVMSPYTWNGSLPANSAPITITTNYGGVDYGTTRGANLTLGATVYIAGDITFDDIDFVASVNNVCMYCQFNNVTFTDSVATTPASGVTRYPFLFGGFRVANTAYDTDNTHTAEKFSYTGNQTLTVNGGTWICVKDGNQRLGQLSPLGTFNGTQTVNFGGNLVINGGGKSNDVQAYVSTATGANINKGTVNFNITGGRYTVPLYAISRRGTCYNYTTTYGTGTSGVLPGCDVGYDVNINMRVTGGDFTAANCDEIGAIQVPGETPVHGSFGLAVTGGSYGSAMTFVADGVLGAKTATGIGDAYVASAVDFDRINGSATANEEPLRIACVGDSITEGVGASAVSVNGYSYASMNYNYPSNLSKLYGNDAVIGNFGYSSSRAEEGAGYNYIDSGAYNFSLEFDPDIIIIGLGTNNTSNKNGTNSVSTEQGRTLYNAGMRELIESYHTAFPSVRIYITNPIERAYEPNNTYNVDFTIPIQKQLAADYDYVDYVDLRKLFSPYYSVYPANYNDNTHPNNDGYVAYAQILYDFLENTVSFDMPQALDESDITAIMVDGMKKDVATCLISDANRIYIKNTDITSEANYTGVLQVLVNDANYSNLAFTINKANGVFTTAYSETMTDALGYVGSAIRLNAPAGLRYKASLDMNIFDADTVLNEVGVLVRTAEQYNRDRRLNTSCTSADYVGRGAAFKLGDATYGDGVWFRHGKDDNINHFTSVLINIPKNNYKTAFVFRSYAVIEEGGTEYTIYSDITATSIYGVAELVTGPDAEAPFIKEILASSVSEGDAPDINAGDLT